MTYDEIMALEEGPEMDAAVATGVMGWVRHDKCGRCWISPKHIYIDGIYIGDNWDGKECHPFIRSPEGQNYYLCPCDGEKRDSGPPPPNASTDDAAMIQVVDRMIARGKDFELYHDSEGWSCHFTGTGLVYEETRGMAVCRAALLATIEGT